MKKGEQPVIIFKYKEISEGVVENHIDYISNEILYTEHHEGEPGQEYKIESKEFEGYDLVEDELPTNAEGVMTRELIEVNYYYIKQAKVIVEYIDKNTGLALETPVEINGHEGDSYSTESKVFEGYELVAEPENKEGLMTAETIYVRYYYVHKSAGVIEKHIDIMTDELLEE